MRPLCHVSACAVRMLAEGAEYPPADYVLIGHLGRRFQLEGGLAFLPLGEPERAAIEQLSAVFVQDMGLTSLERVRRVSGRTIVYLAGVTGVDAATSLANRAVYAAAKALPEEPEQRDYSGALIGRLVTVDRRRIGEVIDVIEASGYGLLVVDTGDEQLLLPAVADYVEVDEHEVRVIEPPEGLLTLHRSS